jgi:hypothetical protein
VRFLYQGNTGRSTTIFDTFAWPTERTLEDFVSMILTMAQHKKQLSTPNVNKECKQVLCNKWCEFKVLGKGKN